MCRAHLLLDKPAIVVVVNHLATFHTNVGAEWDLLQCDSAFGFVRVAERSLSGCVARSSKLSPETAVSYLE